MIQLQTDQSVNHCKLLLATPVCSAKHVFVKYCNKGFKLTHVEQVK